MHLARSAAWILCLLALAAAQVDAHDKATPCRDAEYTLSAGTLGDTVLSDTIQIGAHAGLGGACAPTARVRRVATRNGITRVIARWPRCAGFLGAVTLKGRLVDDCTHLVGQLRTTSGRRDVDALRTDCGDGILATDPPSTPYLPTTASLATHPLPAWYAGAKFGIMIHWGIFDVPAWAETTLDPADWLNGQLLQPPDYGSEFFAHIPYVEWYWNTISIPGSPAQQHHADTWGADFPYENFRPLFETQAAAWNGDAWADAFRDAGARYVVLVTKHHDGFALWPTAVPHPVKADWHLARDVVGELNAAVRKRCMRMGLYYSGGFDWSIKFGPVKNVIDAATTLPTSPEYVAYADGQWRELVSRYRPAVLWNDIGYPPAADALGLFADFYNAVPDGVINDRFTLVGGQTQHDFITPEFTVLQDISAEKFETVRGMGHGFGYNQNETDADYDSAETLIRLLVDVVSKNGNLLLNVGPKADGTIPIEQTSRLQAIGAWLRTNGAAIFGSTPWTHAAGQAADGTPLRFTTSNDGKTLNVFVMGPVGAGELVLPGLGVRPIAVALLGSPDVPPSSVSGADLHLTLAHAPAAQPVTVFALTLAR